MGYDRGDSFPFDVEPNGNPFGSKSKGKLSPRSYRIQCERNWMHSFLSAADSQKQKLKNYLVEGKYVILESFLEWQMS